MSRERFNIGHGSPTNTTFVAIPPQVIEEPIKEVEQINSSTVAEEVLEVDAIEIQEPVVKKKKNKSIVEEI